MESKLTAWVWFAEEDMVDDSETVVWSLGRVLL